MYELLDFRTKKKVTPDNLVFTGKDGPWEVKMDMELVRSRINKEYFKHAPPQGSKYLPLMPIKRYDSFVTLGEGATPLIRSTRLGEELGIDLYFKLESQNPTGAFKDRGSAVEISIARELGAKAVVVASTGNMAASISCYAAAAHMPCFVFVPEDTPTSKMAQVISYGGRIVQVKGSYGDAARIAYEVAQELGFYLCGDYAFRVEGHKTAAFEVAEQLFYDMPEAVVVPMGCGTNIASYYRGFQDYQELDFIERMPRLIGVQAEGAPTIVDAFKKGAKEGVTFNRVSSIAGAIAINHALDATKALDAIYSSNGSACAVSDTEMLEAQYSLAREEGFFVEAACAATVASLRRYAKELGLLGKRVVCVLTGAGLKDPSPILKIAIKPPTIFPDVEDFLSLYKNSFFEGKSVSFVDRGHVIFDAVPSAEETLEKLDTYFSLPFSEQQVAAISAVIERFLRKGKPITFSDLQDIVQEVLEKPTERREGAFTVLDFTVHTYKDKKSSAEVTVRVGKKDVVSSGEGVGPVDAVIAALKKACGDSFQFSLSNYKVNIRSEGTNAVVYVELKLAREEEVSVGSGASPDIIQASIEAFENAYNALT